MLDLTHALAGPFCTYQLQLLGAEVIKIERPGVGDDFREFARPDGWPVGPSFIAVNGGKKSVTIDLKHAAGQEIVHRLASRSDVVVENQRPGSLARLGLDWDSLREVNPRLVYCSLSGFGQTGERRDWLAYDHTIQAMAGMMWNGGDDVPTQGRGFSVDCFTGYLGLRVDPGQSAAARAKRGGSVPGRGHAGCEHGPDGRGHRAPVRRARSAVGDPGRRARAADRRAVPDGRPMAVPERQLSEPL